MDGVFLINKPKGWTSFDICAKLRKKFDTKRVGHSGTLDPFAEGLMIVAMGKATKILAFIEDSQKTYVAQLALGKATDTLDLTGTIVKEAEVPVLDNGKIQEVLKKYLGTSMQIPPMYSALKKDGMPLYALAREGIEVERAKREINISKIDLVSFENNIITFEVTVSRGTYIRSLALDIAHDLNTEGHLISLVRTSIGHRTLEDASLISEVTESNLISIEKILSFMKTIVVDENEEKKVRNGVRLKYPYNNQMILLVNEKHESLAIYEKKDDGFYYSKRGLF